VKLGSFRLDDQLLAAVKAIPSAGLQAVLLASGAEGAGEAAADSERETPQGGRPPRIAALVLAAGRSSRMEGPAKLVCEIDGVPMVRRAVDAALDSRCVQTLLVTGHDAEAVEAAIGHRPVSLVENPRPEDGMATSLRLGLRALAQDIEGVVVLLADMPRITAAHVDRLVAAFDPAAPAIVAPERGGRRGNPVLWPQRYFAEMMALAGDQGARSLLERHADDLLLVPIDDEAIFIDIDTPADLDRLGQS
jgi:molybdenum cofactor cytidylyltransferase